MPTDEGPDTRPLCPCHGEAMDRNKDGHECAVRRRERHRRYYRADPLGDCYARTRRRLRERIRAKRALIEEMDHATKDPGRDS